METKVLIAEDDYYFRQLLSNLFNDYGCRIKAVDRGDDCMAALFQERIDLAVVDYHLPGMKGDVIISTARKYDITVPIIIITADNSLGIEQAVRKHGPAYFLVKPFNMKDLGAIYRKITAIPKAL
ncbi:MAG: response regulator [Chitinispirillaceae bacterium]